jgi:short-subunit dehydrogenase
MNMLPFTGPALITGASSGLGEAFARRLASLKVDLVLVARREDRLRALGAELEKEWGIRAEVLAADLADEAGLLRVEDFLRPRPDLGLLVNNAGFGGGGRFWKTDPAHGQSMIRVHVEAVVRLTRAALPATVERGSGALINVASVAAFYTFPGSVLYGSTKTWIVAFGRALALELRGKGVRVQALCPGFTHTGFHDTPELREMKETGIPKFLWMPAEQVIEKSLRALARGPVVCVPGFRNKILVAIPRIPFASPLIRRFSRLRD